VVQKIVIFLLFLFAGAVSALAFIYIVGTSPVRFDSPLLTSFNVKKPEVVGFLPYWLLTKATRDYTNYVTTMTYFGLTVGGDGHVQKLTNPQEEEPGYAKLQSYTTSPNFKNSLLVVSGDDGAIGAMIQDPVASANNLVSDIMPIMKEKNFTDVNLDIESFMTASESARANFTSFVTAVTDLVKKQHLGTVTLDLIPISLVKSDLYDAKEIGAVVDRVVLMTYDYHYTGSFTAGANAPIGGAGQILEYDTETAVKEALNVIPANKLLLGIPLYGYEWETLQNSPEAATIPGGSSVASVDRVAGILSSCASCSAQLDQVAREPYVIYPENDYYNEIYYENEASMKEKLSMAQKYHLGGVALWALGYEDNTILNPLTNYKNTLDLSGLY